MGSPSVTLLLLSFTRAAGVCCFLCRWSRSIGNEVCRITVLLYRTLARWSASIFLSGPVVKGMMEKKSVLAEHAWGNHYMIHWEETAAVA